MAHSTTLDLTPKTSLVNGLLAGKKIVGTSLDLLAEVRYDHEFRA